ncbi:MAG: hypothetical protein HY763_16030 [Planctomycetes bacterium]|nr:hypothetical protein [Planctomycetota bacterium]
MVNQMRIRCAAALLLGWTAAGLAATPTFSLEATAINGVPIPGAPVKIVTAMPGDRITAEVYVRDWSPEGEALGAFQAALNPDGFTTGAAGFVEPVNYSLLQAQKSPDPAVQDPDNPDVCFVDRNHPRYVHKDLRVVAITDTRSEGYRWLSLDLEAKGPISAQDGTKYYGGTVYFTVSENAEGKFTIGFIEDDNYTGFRIGVGAAILPVNYESLGIQVPRPTDRGYLEAVVERLISRRPAPNPKLEIQTVDGKRKAVPDLLRAIERRNAGHARTPSTHSAEVH